MARVIPLKPVASQVLSVNLGGQNCQLKIYQKLTGLYLDLYVDHVLVIGGVICQNVNRIVRSLYLGFDGDLCFFDNQGNDDPKSTELGTRFSLLYMETTDLAPGVG